MTIIHQNYTILAVCVLTTLYQSSNLIQADDTSNQSIHISNRFVSQIDRTFPLHKYTLIEWNGCK